MILVAMDIRDATKNLAASTAEAVNVLPTGTAAPVDFASTDGVDIVAKMLIVTMAPTVKNVLMGLV